MKLSSLSSPGIYIYAGPGVSPIALKHTEYTLKKLVHPRYKIQIIGPEEVIQGTWVKNAVLFVMPGGVDTPYCQSLNGKGNQQIQRFVQKGGAYLGFCAGAYYAGKHVLFAVGTPLETVGNRELSFYSGNVEGPTLAPYDYHSNAGSRVAYLEWQAPSLSFSKNQIFTAYYNGGGHFVNAPAFTNVTILANYLSPSSPKAAIVEIAVGKGHVILSGVHTEYALELLDPLDAYLQPLKEELNLKNQARVALMCHLLERLGIETVAL